MHVLGAARPGVYSKNGIHLQTHQMVHPIVHTPYTLYIGMHGYL